MGLKELTKKFDAVKKEMAELGKEQILAEFKVLFDAHPDVEAVRWRQYTPHFNDGEACTFDVHDFYFKVKGADADEGDYQDGFECSWGLDGAKGGPLTQFNKAFHSEAIEEILRLAFGDHMMVTATRDGFEAEEFDHD